MQTSCGVNFETPQGYPSGHPVLLITPVKDGRPDETKWRLLRALPREYVDNWPSSAESLTGYDEKGTTYTELFRVK